MAHNDFAPVSAGSITRVSEIPPALARSMPPPHPQASNQVFLVSVKALLAEAESQRELLVKEGMTATFLADFAASVQAVEVASEAARNARRDHMAATADLDLIAKDLLELVRVLDGINRYRFRKDPETMAAWNAVKGLPFKSKRGDAAPPGTGEIAPAA